MTTIYFYKAENPYGCFSNFSPHTVFLNGKTWLTSEHYFQAQKFADTPLEEQVRMAATPGKAAKIGRARSNPLRTDWEEVKDDIMSDVVRAKFTQHADLADILLSTGDAVLVEHTANDRYWADGGDGSGLNRLGQILMNIRQELKQSRFPS